MNFGMLFCMLFLLLRFCADTDCSITYISLIVLINIEEAYMYPSSHSQ